MIIHHMKNGYVRDSIDGMVIPKTFEQVYILARRAKQNKENDNGNSIKSEDIRKK